MPLFKKEGGYSVSNKKQNGMKDEGHENPSYKENGTSKHVSDGEIIAIGDSKQKPEDNEKKKEEVKTVGWFQVYRYADKWDVILMVLGTLCAMGHGAAMPGLIIVFGEMIDLFVNNAKMVPNSTLAEMSTCNFSKFGIDSTNMDTLFNNQQLVRDLLTDCNKTWILDTLMEQAQIGLTSQMGTFALYYTYIGIAVLFIAYGQVAFWLIPSYRQTQKIRTLLFRHIMRQEIGWFDTHEVGELNTRLTDDINKLQEGIGDKVSNFFQWFSTCIGGFVVGFVYGWKLTLVIISVSPLLVASGGFMATMTTMATKKELSAYAKAGAVAEEVFGAIRTVVAFGGEKKECQRYNGNLDEAKNFGIRKAMVSGLGMGMVFFIMFSVYALAFWYGTKLVREDEYTAGKMIIVFFCVLFGAFSLGNAAPNLQNMGTARGAAYVLWELLDRKSMIDSSSTEGSRPTEVQGNIEFKNVHFNYPSRPDSKVLQGLSLNVNVGQTVALVGSSGCGKSTTVQLIQRFYDPEDGVICLDGQDIRTLNIQWLRQHIGLVSQEPVLFDTTIKENIMFGRDGCTDEDIMKAAKEANAHDFIMKLPKKYETLVGERGAQLSGGQKQRIAIARALVSDPRILLLDEATSALDTESEAVVQAALDKAREGRTTLVIAHRLSTIKNADVIYSIQKGVVYESGTHKELMAKGTSGIYYHLVTNQQMMQDASGEMIEEVEHHHPKLDRGMSVDSATTRKHLTSESEAKVEKDKEGKLPDVSMLTLLKMNSPEWFYILIGCIGSIINGGVQPAFAIVFSEILGVLSLPKDQQESKSLLYSMLFFAIAVAAGVSMFLGSYMFGKSGEHLTVRIRQKTFASILRQDLSFFDDHNNSTGALCTRLATDASAVQGATGTRLGTVCMSLSSVGAGIIIGFIFSWKLTLAILCFVPIVMIAGALQMKILGGQAHTGQEALEAAGKVAIQSLENIRTVASLTKEPHFDREYTRHTMTPHKSKMRKVHLVGFTFSFSQSVVFFIQAAAFYFGAWLIENDNLEFQNMFKVFAGIIFGAMAVGQASAFAPDYGKAKASASRIWKLFEREPLIDSYSEEGDKPADVTGTVQFSDVNFCYPTRPTVPVLQGLNVTVEPKQVLAFVGSSGCGKSTAVSLIERFYDTESGSVSIDGHDIKKLNIQWLRQQLGIVQQEPILFGTSIRENIAYGDNSREVTMDEIIQAARNANIHSFIESLPDGYETNVGDKGAQLSGGQKQRVAIARALVRNPKILLLDEATSALDTESEKIVQEALDKAQEGRTTIVIAHRLSTIQNAHCITVIHNGKVSESGTHSELMAKQGIYYKLNMAQQKQKGK